MSHDNQKNQGFASEESWLNEHLLDNEEPNADFIKLRMRIEIEEQWLLEELQQEDLQFVAIDVRRALRERVRQEIENIQVEQLRKIRRRLRGWPIWVGTAVAAAAAVVFVVTKPSLVEHTDADESTIWLSAFEAYTTDTFGTEMSEIDSELNTFADSLVALDNPWLSNNWASEPTDFDENDRNNSGLQEKSRNQGAGAESGT